ncbi:cytochrome c-type biogenesis protein CcmH [Marivibrio halodurans]|uniref:Cytochrome c-type biogenesis protein n=1 Tax=Marivibrio halodurans TaxID=2039722 RepID=A0A8J7S0E7_9PROT|nr:cytochrome c-type biogenesis protein [Marivibrio halodurans]MBP5858062.1 cytochrome c-type biogenesis protein CcmH [Marivibrio halodurans]
MIRSLLLALAVVVAALPALAVQPDEMLDDPALERRAREISQDVRCLVCQNQSIDESNADLARDLRVLVRERVKQGDTNQEVRDYLVARYGDYVLLKPPFGLSTLLLWASPALLLLVGALAVFLWFRGRGRASATQAGGAEAALSAEERRRLDRLLAGEDGPEDDGSGRDPGDRRA